MVSMYVFPNAVSDNVRVRMRGARCTAGKTATQREPVPARPVREAHLKTAVEDAVCGAEAGRMCCECMGYGSRRNNAKRVEPESEQEPKLVITEGASKTEKKMQTWTKHRQPEKGTSQQTHTCKDSRTNEGDSTTTLTDKRLRAPDEDNER